MKLLIQPKWMVQTLKSRNGNESHSALCRTCNYLSVQGLNFINVSTSGPEIYCEAGCHVVAPTSAWWRRQMETFSMLLALCAGNSPVTGEILSQRPMTRSFDAFFDLSLNKRLSKQSRRGWLEMASRSLWRHCNDTKNSTLVWRFG